MSMSDGERGEKIRLVYVVGPYRAATERAVVENIRNAEAVALMIWQAGFVAICPHMNTALFGGACPDEVWLAGDLEILRRCDAVVVCPGWHASTGSRAEVATAKTLGIPVFATVLDLSEAAARAVGGKG